MTTSFFLGLDLGQTNDFTALAVIEQALFPGDTECSYALRHLHRFPLGTPYTAIVSAVAAIAGRKALAGSPLVVDQTGMGRPVVDMLRRAADRVVPVTITSGRKVTQKADGSYRVPKKELVTRLQVVLQSRRMQIARRLPEAATLVRELQAFQVRITEAANETFGTWRQGQHDDLVLAVALACWWAERNPATGMGSGRGGSLIDARAEGFLP
jgi:hypothetical protein